MAKQKKATVLDEKSYSDGTPKGQGLKSRDEAIIDSKKTRPKTNSSQRKKPSKIKSPFSAKQAEKAMERKRKKADAKKTDTWKKIEAELKKRQASNPDQFKDVPF